MSYMLRSVFRRVLFEPVGNIRRANLYAFQAYNHSRTEGPTFSQRSRDRSKESNNKHYWTKNLIKLETDLTKRGVVQLDDLKQILEMLEAKKSISNALAMKLLCCCGKLLAHESPLTRIQLAQKMWDSFAKYGVQYSIIHYNALLRVYVENNYPFNPDDIMKELSANGLAPNADTYQFFIAKYCLKGDIDNTNRLLMTMREQNMPIMLDVYRSLIICHSKNNNMEDADNVIDVVAKMEPDLLPSVYSTLIIEYIRKRDLKKALAVFNTGLTKLRYNLNEYFDILFELAVNGYENEFYRKLQEFKHPSDYNLRVPLYVTKLIAAGKPEYAYMVLRTMHQLTRPTGTRVVLGPFFISNLVNYNVPSSKITELCLDMMKTKFNELALQVAMHESLRLKKEELALDLFHAARSNNLPIKLHYFWPLLLNRGKNNDTAGIFHLLDVMYHKFGLMANAETLRYYIIPYIYSTTMDVNAFMLKFKPYGVTISSLVSSTVHYLLTQKEFRRAAEIAESYGASYPMHRYQAITVHLYVETKDCNSFVKLMKAYCMGSVWQQNLSKREQNRNEPGLSDQRDIFDVMMYSAVKKLVDRKEDAKYIAELFQCMLKNKIVVSSEKIELVEGILSDHGELNSCLSSLLERMKLEKVTTKLTFKAETDVAADEKSLERLYENMEAGVDKSELSKKYLFNLYARNHNLEKLLELKKKLEAENYELNGGMYSYVIDTLVEHGKWEEALDIFRDRMKKDENFQLDFLKLNRLALLLVQNDRIEDAREVLSESRATKVDNAKRLILPTRVYSELLKCLTAKGNVQAVEDFFALYQTRGFGNVTIDILESLVQTHLMRNDVENALKKYLQCVDQHNQSPCRDALLRALVADGDKKKLNRFLSASSFSHGEEQTLYRLLVVYSEMGKIEEAKRLLQSRVLKLSRSGSKHLMNACEAYCENNDAKSLLNLFLVTRGTKLFDRDDLCAKILKACCNSNDVRNAQTLWTEIQDEDIVPSSDFLNSLAKLFKRNGVPVNFNHVAEPKNNVSVSSNIGV